MAAPIPFTDDDKLLVRHILDIAARSEKVGRTLYSNFLDERQLAICETALKSDYNDNYITLGGYEGAERRVLAFGISDEDEAYPPFEAVVFNHPENSGLSHRDFLGSLMALGIKRELLGDILVGKKRTAVFVIDSALPLVYDMSKIGKCGVKITTDFSEEDIPQQEFDEIHSTVASLRLDAVIASGLRLSREKAAELIKTKGVMHNRVMTFNTSEKVAEGDRFSIRGFGKCELFKVGGLSKKDRVFITIRKFR